VVSTGAPRRRLTSSRRVAPPTFLRGATCWGTSWLLALVRSSRI